MEPEGSSPFLQNCDIPTQSQINSVQAILACSFEVHFNIIIQSKVRSAGSAVGIATGYGLGDPAIESY